MKKTLYLPGQKPPSKHKNTENTSVYLLELDDDGNPKERTWRGSSFDYKTRTFTTFRRQVDSDNKVKCGYREVAVKTGHGKIHNDIIKANPQWSWK